MYTVAIDARDAQAGQLRGWGRYAAELIAALERRAPARGIQIATLTGRAPGPELIQEQLAMPRELRRISADAVHAPNCFLPLRRPCPGVVTIHDLAFERYPADFSRRTGWKYRTFARRAARSAERVICVSEHTRADVCERYGVDRARTHVIPEAAALPLGSLEPPPGPYLLAVGDLRGKKNIVRLVEAFALARERGLPHRLVLAGLDTGGGERVRAAAGRAPVELAGYVSDAQLDALMRGADLLVHPSLYEGFGLVILEAMARGCPVAAARATALPETGGDAAAYFDPQDVEDMAVTIQRAAGDRDLAERGLARAARFSWDATAEATLDVYAEVLA